jgi:hypothetical protein
MYFNYIFKFDLNIILLKISMVTKEHNFSEFTKNFSRILRSIWSDKYQYQIDYLERGEIDKFHKIIGHPMYGFTHIIEEAISCIKESNRGDELDDNIKHYLYKLYGI